MQGAAADLAACAAGYAIGSIPVGVLIGRLAGGLDVREHGSGSMGTTNVLRLAGPGAAALTFALDVGKGAAAVAVAKKLGAGRRAQVLAGIASVAGHSWPVFARFRGGKGVATGFGALLVVEPRVAPYPVAGGLTALAASRIMSVGSLSAAASAVLGSSVHALRRGDTAALEYSLLASLLIGYRHAANIGRLVRGEEPRVSLQRASRS
jgi:acyl phosphate:glycerol-3-phosphate acyltransferase